VIGFFRKISLGKRYKFGFLTTLFTGFIMLMGGQIPFTDYGLSWGVLTFVAVIHFLVAPVYLWWERRWYRYVMLLYSAGAIYSYVRLTMKVWGTA